MRPGSDGHDLTLRPRSVIVLAMGAAAIASGCGVSVRSAATEVPRIATPAVIDASLGSFEDPQVRERVARVMGTPEMQQAVRDAAAAAVSGGVREFLTTAMDARATQVAESVAGALVRGGAAEIPRTLAPAVRQAIVESLDSPDMRNALRDTTREVVRATLVDTRDMFVQLDAERDRTGPLQRFVNLLRWSWALAALLGALVATLAVWTNHLVSKAKKLEIERARLVRLQQNPGS
jgi:hypothetical protein